ncbi:MAG TPA: hypothetical protein VG734_18390 [Lacunisphaera sp.]|nr:hypothetical protein [Lacunisphaera sp.]
MTLTFALPLWPADDQAPKEYSVFVGQDVSVVRNGKHLRVVGAQKKAVEVLIDGKLTIIPLSEAKDLQLDRGVKLSNVHATIENVRGAQGESRIQAAAEMESMITGMYLQDAAEDQRQAVLGEAVEAGIFAQRPQPGLPNGEVAPQNPALASSADNTALTQLPSLERNIDISAKLRTDINGNKSEAAGGLDDTGYNVSFQVSAPTPLEQCHLAVISEYTLPGDTNLTLTSVTIQPIADLNPTPRKVTCEVRRFPPGAKIKGYRIALYSRGQEIVTNLSSRRTDVTRDEAVLFMTMDYLSKHPNETRPPAPILMVPRTEFIARLGSTPLDQVIYARVGKDGKIIRLSTDAKGSSQLPPELNGAIDQVAFAPALEKGKPVEGVAKLKLADLVASN